uniref:Uncharacterized protein n=1 Tax=Lotus japonicus TaxID=34305 RepID=I3S0V0_LOTJA|nr:unknown [Lotus japonicus]
MSCHKLFERMGKGNRFISPHSIGKRQMIVVGEDTGDDLREEGGEMVDGVKSEEGEKLVECATC